jgi:hypothetical protein
MENTFQCAECKRIFRSRRALSMHVSRSEHRASTIDHGNGVFVDNPHEQPAVPLDQHQVATTTSTASSALTSTRYVTSTPATTAAATTAATISNN